MLASISITERERERERKKKGPPLDWNRREKPSKNPVTVAMADSG